MGTPPLIRGFNQTKCEIDEPISKVRQTHQVVSGFLKGVGGLECRDHLGNMLFAADHLDPVFFELRDLAWSAKEGRAAWKRTELALTPYLPAATVVVANVACAGVEYRLLRGLQVRFGYVVAELVHHRLLVIRWRKTLAKGLTNGCSGHQAAGHLPLVSVRYREDSEDHLMRQGDDTASGPLSSRWSPW